MRRCKTHDCPWAECHITYRYLGGECKLDRPTYRGGRFHQEEMTDEQKGQWLRGNVETLVAKMTPRRRRNVN